MVINHKNQMKINSNNMKTNNENMNYYARNNMFVLNSIFTGFIYIWNEIKIKYIVQFS
jgi:hypothetical protein